MLIGCKKLGFPCSSHQELAKCPTSGIEEKIGVVELGGFGDVEEDILASKIGKCIHEFNSMLFMLHMEHNT
jgi:hypothetical protein